MTRIPILAFLVIAACGGSGGDDAIGDAAPGDPVLTPGGGVAGGAIAGVVNVFVIDDDGGAPIAGATVQVGNGPTATTGANGLAVFSDAVFTGPQTVTATAAGRVAATWIGMAGSSATIPLEPTAVPTARATGTIAGWNSLPAPSFGNYNLGVILYTLTDDVGARENTLSQPAPGGTPANTCLRSAVSNTCAWQLTTRIGRQVHFAVIVEGNPQGTTGDPTDDTYTLIGYAVGESMTMTPGQQLTNEMLTMVPGTMMTPLSTAFSSAPPGLAERIALPMLDLGDDGRIVFPLPTVTPTAAATRVITPTGRFAGTYDVIGVATPAGATSMPYSTVFARAVSPGGTATLDAFLPAPSQVTASGGTYSFTGVDATAIRYATFTRAGTRAWTVSVLDGSSSFTLPAVSPDPLGTGTIDLEVTAADVPGVDPASFTIPALTAALARAAGATTSFTH